ncbi:MAG: hypothetical protein OXU20_17695 [Myxococcales bacterium]|nr:hypothetical protein [Myxococcales bacterium]
MLERGVSRIGPLTVAISGSSELMLRCARELEAEPSSIPADLEVRVDDDAFADGYEPTVFSAKQNFHFRPDEFYRKDPVPKYVRGLFGGESVAQVRFGVRPPRPGVRQRVGNLVSTLRGRQQLNPVMNYAGFWGALHFALLRRDAAFFHAGMYATTQGAVALAGTGGSGKTSLLFTLLESRERTYLAEDFSIISAQGDGYYCPKDVTIYASDTRQPLLARFVEASSERCKALRPTRARPNPRIKVSPRDVLGGRVGSSAPLARVLYLVRSAADEVKVEPVGADEMAKRAAHVAQRELKAWVESLHLIGANQTSEEGFPSPADVADRVDGIYQSAFSKADCLLVHLPAGHDPRRIIDALMARNVLP